MVTLPAAVIYMARSGFIPKSLTCFAFVEFYLLVLSFLKSYLITRVAILRYFEKRQVTSEVSVYEVKQIVGQLVGKVKYCSKIIARKV